jgi:hypothetical protein
VYYERGNIKMKKLARTAAALVSAAALAVTGAAPCFGQTMMAANAVDTNGDD